MRKYILIIITSFVSLVFTACEDIDNLKTNIEVEDNNRHYYPILRGQKLKLKFTLLNTGKNAFVLDEMLISCGCIVGNNSSIETIPPNKPGELILTFDSNKNIGYVKHHISIYGNFENKEKIDLVFDVNVVPDSDYTKDYEEIYFEANKKEQKIISERKGKFKA